MAAAFVSGLAATCRSQDLAATFLAQVADRLEEAYAKQDT